MQIAVYDLAILMTFIGICLGLWKEKRRFDRRNSFGIEQFNSFGGKIVSKTFDALLTWISIGLTLLGLLILAFHD